MSQSGQGGDGDGAPTGPAQANIESLCYTILRLLTATLLYLLYIRPFPYKGRLPEQLFREVQCRKNNLEAFCGARGEKALKWGTNEASFAPFLIAFLGPAPFSWSRSLSIPYHAKPNGFRGVEGGESWKACCCFGRIATIGWKAPCCYSITLQLTKQAWRQSQSNKGQCGNCSLFPSSSSS